VIGLDGYEPSLAAAMMASGKLPALAQLRGQSATFQLDHGPARLTGLAWEHVSSGLSPEDGGRQSAVVFDPHTYEVWQEGAWFVPFPASMRARTVVFDVPYFDLNRAPHVQGISAWGAHDAGTPLRSNPPQLLEELFTRHAPYPATEWIYGFAWPSPEKCRKMGDDLANALLLRRDIALWLLRKRFPNWDLALIGVSESHSGLEALWHGVDSSHPLANHRSAPSARAAVERIYLGIDQLVSDLIAAFPDAQVVVFSMHGMGPNRADVPSMVLLPELLHRHAFGRHLFVQPERWAGTFIPELASDEQWQIETPDARGWIARVRDRLNTRIPRLLHSKTSTAQIHGSDRQTLDWMPAARYQPCWRNMPAFAIPAYYDGRIRINLRGRERHGLVALENYESYCAELIALLQSCIDPDTGTSPIAEIDLPARKNPLKLSATGSDLTIIWKGIPLALSHPELGQIGPVPIRRTGGHTGGFGMAYIRSPRLPKGDRGVRSSFDVVPTLFDLLDEPMVQRYSGRSLAVP